MQSRPTYITNKDLLREIHKSKTTFCSFIDPEHADYDVIVADLDSVTPELMAEVLHKKLNPRGKNAVPAKPYTLDDIVIRHMTHEHIPLDPDRKRKARNTDVSYARTNFPPFKHYVMREGVLKEVCRSHWKGGFDNGHFCLDGGGFSKSLATMFMMLVERYARRGNWRGYCVDEATQALTKRGWVEQADLTEADTILSYRDGALTWSAIKSIYRAPYDGDMFHLTTSRGLDTLITPGHKLVTADHGLKPVEYLLEKDRVVLMGGSLRDTAEPVHSDALVELVGWVATQGIVHSRREDSGWRGTVRQTDRSRAERIRACGRALGRPLVEHDENGTIVFDLGGELRRLVMAAVDAEHGWALRSDFVTALTQSQRTLLIDTMLAAQHHGRTSRRDTLRRYTQASRDHVDAFTFLCALSGIRTRIETRRVGATGTSSTAHTVTLFSEKMNHAMVENIDFHGGKRAGSIKGRGKHLHANEPTVSYRGVVWCPETEHGCFVARRHDGVFLTGNTYVDEMRSHALLQLSQVGLQFDESKGDNPFAFFTTTIHNCFTRVLNVEKKNQKIRDDMLVMAGVAPSYTRQIENEIEQRFPSDTVAKTSKPKRGAPRRKTVVKDHDAS